MPTYSEFVATPEYKSKQAGAAIKVLIMLESDPTRTIIGAVSGLQYNDALEAIGIEEAGNDGVDEIIQGRHSGNLSVNAFWTAEWNDELPTRQTFLGSAGGPYTVLEMGSDDRPNMADVVLNAFVGCRIDSMGANVGARGPKTMDIRMLFTRRHSGSEWAALTGA